ncbi:MAG: metallophosphoesterase [Ignisphaera sp.]|nr:metallophosphoesterase [Ignisphaera sp.]
MVEINILSFSDTHGVQYLPLLVSSLNALHNRDLDLVVMAGDIADRGRVESASPIIEVLKRFFKDFLNVPKIVAVFGNEEYMGSEELFIERFKDVVWINDTYIKINVKGIDICIVGSRGVLKRPTQWQERNIPNIREIYSQRLRVLAENIAMCRQLRYYTILVTHYASTYATVYGESPAIYPYLGYPIIEELSVKPHIAIHGHAHNATRLEAVVDGVKVYNVALPARKGVTLIKVLI